MALTSPKMNLSRIKTDKADAEMTCKYAQKQDLKACNPSPVYVKESRIISENIDLLLKSRTMFKNWLHAMRYKSEKHRRILIKPLDKIVLELTHQISEQEAELKRIIEEHESDLFLRLQTIPVIGESTSMFMIVMSDGFKKLLMLKYQQIEMLLAFRLWQVLQQAQTPQKFHYQPCRQSR